MPNYTSARRLQDWPAHNAAVIALIEASLLKSSKTSPST